LLCLYGEFGAFLVLVISLRPANYQISCLATTVCSNVKVYSIITIRRVQFDNTHFNPPKAINKYFKTKWITSDIFPDRVSTFCPSLWKMRVGNPEKPWALHNGLLVVKAQSTPVILTPVILAYSSVRWG
jgi:hypothetical protein